MLKLRWIICALFGHSRIVQCSGRLVWCYRCNKVLAENMQTLREMDSMYAVGHHHRRNSLVKNTLTLKDKFLTPKSWRK